MDQLKEKLAVAARHGFWICTAIVTLGSIGVWYLATARLSEENAQRTGELKSDIQSVTQVRSALPTHPNKHSHDRMEELIDSRQQEVLDAWTSVFERQRAILKWPTELGQDFVDEFKDLIPIERFVDYPPTPEQQKNTELLTRYATYIGTTLPRIAEIAKTKWEAEFRRGAGGGYGGDGSDAMGLTPRRGGDQDETLVRWSKASQEKVQGDLFPWLGQRPTTLEVYYSQENLWILKQLLQIIANVNGDAKQPFQARVHEIKQIGIGSSVAFDTGELAKPGESQQARSMYQDDFGGDEDYEDYGDDMYGAEGMEGGTGTAVVVSPDPAENRYVDMQQQPIPAATLRSALNSNRPEDATIAVAKRVPVMMRLKMDQRFVHQLLAECGSAPLMVEARRVRILPQTESAADQDGGMGEDDMGDDYGDDYGAEDAYGGGFDAMTMGTQKTEEFPLDVDVEVYGLIYVYNPPDPEKLGLELVNEETVIDGSSAQPESSPEPLTGEDAPESPQAPLPAPTPETPAEPETPAAPEDSSPPADPEAVEEQAPPAAVDAASELADAEEPETIDPAAEDAVTEEDAAPLDANP